MDVVKNISVVIGAVLQVITISTIFIKPIRKIFATWIIRVSKTNEVTDKLSQIDKDIFAIQEKIASLDKGLDVERKAMQAAIRDRILNIYYKYLPIKEMPAYARQNLTLLKEIYIKDMGGNSFVKEVCEEMARWETLSDVDFAEKYHTTRGG